MARPEGLKRSWAAILAESSASSRADRAAAAVLGDVPAASAAVLDKSAVAVNAAPRIARDLEREKPIMCLLSLGR